MYLYIVILNTLVGIIHHELISYYCYTQYIGRYIHHELTSSI